MSKVNIIKSNKGNQKLCIDGYLYHLERNYKSGTSNWACAKRKVHMCRSRVVTKIVNGNVLIVKNPNQHTHEPIAIDLNIANTNNMVKTLAKRSSKSPCQIIQESIVQASKNSRDFLPSKNAQNVKIKRFRKKVCALKEPENIEDIDIPLSLYVVEREMFIQSEVMIDNDGMIIIMATQTSIKLLENSDCWLVDGTFEVVPSFMRQLFSVHGRVEGEVVPLAFCLMTKKSTSMYTAFFRELLKIGEKYGCALNPTKIISDFEVGIAKAIQLCFPRAQTQGCFFHFSQIIWRRVQKER